MYFVHTRTARGEEDDDLGDDLGMRDYGELCRAMLRLKGATPAPWRGTSAARKKTVAGEVPRHACGGTATSPGHSCASLAIDAHFPPSLRPHNDQPAV